MKSIIQDENDRKCFLCSSTRNLEMHHIFNGNPMRQKSEDFGAKVWFCRRCHEDIHRDNLKRNALKGFAQRIMMQHYGWTINDWRNIFCHKNYL